MSSLSVFLASIHSLVGRLDTHAYAIGHGDIAQAGYIDLFDAGNVIAKFIRSLTPPMVSIDSAYRAEVVASDARIPLIQAEFVFPRYDRKVGEWGARDDRAPSGAQRTIAALEACRSRFSTNFKLDRATVTTSF